MQTFPHFLNSSFCLTTQVSTIATSDGYGKNLADAFETAARLQGIRIHASARLPAMATSGDIDSKVQMVRDFLSYFDQNGLLTLAFEGWSLKAYTEMALKHVCQSFDGNLFSEVNVVCAACHFKTVLFCQVIDVYL